MKKILKACSYFLICLFLTSLLAVGLEGIFSSSALAGFTIFVGFFISIYLSYKLAFGQVGFAQNMRQGEGISISLTPSLNISTESHQFNKKHTDTELDSISKGLMSLGSSRLDKSLEITIEAQPENLKQLTHYISGHAKEYIRSEGVSSDCTGSLESLHYSILKNEASLKELDELAIVLRIAYDDGLAKVKASQNYIEAGEHDQESIVDEWKDQFSDNIVNKCFGESYIFNGSEFLEYFILGDSNADYSMFKEYGYNDSALILNFAYRLESGSLFRVASDSYNYKDLKRLVSIGVFTSGDQLDSKLLLSLLKVNEIKELAESKGIVVKGRKKEDLLSSLLDQATVDAVDVGKFVALREVFSVNPKFISKHKFETNRNTWEKAKLAAEYVSERVSLLGDSKLLEEKLKSSFNRNYINQITKNLKKSVA